MTQREYQHLHWRAGFGLSPENFSENYKDRTDVVDVLFRNSNTASELNVDLSYLDGVSPADIKKYPSLQKEIREKNRQMVLELNYRWMERLMFPKELLRERMTLFWANHFVCRDSNPLYIQHYNNILRTCALGDFGEFVKAISKEAAMLRYLNGKQNRKQKPNENFARELMELFTLGEGHYSEKDIKESARAFTGYNHDYEGNFDFRQRQHDEGSKQFFGRIGNFSGDDIIDIILQDEQCAYFISDKIYRYFVNPRPNEKHIKAMAEVFFEDYNIENVMRFVFMSDWFYETANIGSKIKSPVEYLVGMVNTIPVNFEREKDLIKIQRLLGQTLLDPPNVAGWKGDKAWIDANTIMVRLKLPSTLYSNAEISLKTQNDSTHGFEGKQMKPKKRKLPFKTVPDWDAFLESFKSVETDDLQDFVIQGNINNGTSDYLKSLRKTSKQDYCIQLMSLPEYQMC